MRKRQRTFSRVRRGTAAVLAMLYLVLFSTLALGFYAAVTASVQISGNELRGTRAMLATESGMEFMRFHLAELDVPAGTPSTELFNQVYARLSARLDGYPNMNGEVVEMSVDGNTIYVPSGADKFISVDGQGGQFRAVLEKLQGGQQVRVKVIGRAGNLESKRAVRLDYSVAQNASSIFNYGVASKSPIALLGNTSIVGKGDPRFGSALTTSFVNPAMTLQGNSQISGDASLVNPNAQISISANARIAGFKAGSPDFTDHVHYGVTEPEFPVIDTSAFEAYATNEITGPVAAGTTLSNIRIKANTNPTFGGSVTLNGVVYIETPNVISFTGNTTLNGVMVVQNNPTGTVTSNVIDFGGNVTFSGVETLPESYGDLRQLTGSMVLAPNFHLRMRGNFGVIGGSIIASQTEFSGNAGGTVRGSIINLDDTAFSLEGNTDILIESQGTSNYPAGVFFGSHYAPLPHTYAEVLP